MDRARRDTEPHDNACNSDNLDILTFRGSIGIEKEDWHGIGLRKKGP